MAVNSGPWQLLNAGTPVLSALCLNSRNHMFGACQPSGDIYHVEVGTESGAPRAKTKARPMLDPLDADQVVATTGGLPTALGFDSDSAMFTGDLEFKAIMSQPVDVEGFTQLVSDYEGEGLLGPHSLAFSGDGVLFFTDTGKLGDTSLKEPKGSLFCISPDNRLLRPLALQCLAYPTGVAVAPDDSCIYVAETLKNRVLRFVKRPGDVYHVSTFFQFSGLFGPTGLSCDREGRLYVCRFEFAEAGSRLPGIVTVLDPTGIVLAELDGPGPELSSILVVDNSDGQYVYITETSGGTLHRTHVDSFFGGE